MKTIKHLPGDPGKHETILIYWKDNARPPGNYGKIMILALPGEDPDRKIR
jgi:hypothetical protein